MKTRTLVSILILVLAVLIIIGGCATTSKTKEERDGVTEAEYKFYLDILPQVFGIRESGRRVLKDHTGVDSWDDHFLDDNTIKYIKKETGYILEHEVADDFNRKNEKGHKLNGEMFPSNKFILIRSSSIDYRDKKKAIEDAKKDLEDLIKDHEDEKKALEDEIKSLIESIKKTTPVTDPDYEKIVRKKVEEKAAELIRKKEEESRRKPWDEFHKKYPNSGGLITLSRVGFNKRKNIAICCCSVQAGGLMGVGYHVIAEKKNGKWHLKYKVVSWIS